MDTAQAQEVQITLHSEAAIHQSEKLIQRRPIHLDRNLAHVRTRKSTGIKIRIRNYN